MWRAHGRGASAPSAGGRGASPWAPGPTRPAQAAGGQPCRRRFQAEAEQQPARLGRRARGRARSSRPERRPAPRRVTAGRSYGLAADGPAAGGVSS
ncbi:unnamed protein product [Urochloa humidicola]